MKMADLIFENSSLLLLMEHFNLDIVVRDKSVEEICSENGIKTELFLAVANLYSGFNPPDIKQFDCNDLTVLIQFLRNSHQFYLEEKIPEIQNYIKLLYAENSSKEIQLVEKFFDVYSKEVSVHLGYENAVAFPYFLSLTGRKPEDQKKDNPFSAADYLDHHTDIETKLADLKELLLKHISLKSNLPLRRKLLLGLFELEYNLTIHALIEESILIPLARKTEKSQSCE